MKTLKVEAEAWYVKQTKITLENVIAELRYAEDKNCFLLKEVAMKFILKNASGVLASASFVDMPESMSITREILSLVAIDNQNEAQMDASDPARLSINELRLQAYQIEREGL